METATLVEPPPTAKAPLEGDSESHDAALPAVQLSVLVPVFCKEMDRETGVNGPPMVPLKIRFVEEVINKSSGVLKDSITPEVVELAGADAPLPRPRFAKAAQRSR